MVIAAYLFEVRQIQGYVFATGKLRDASGASELLDSLCGQQETVAEQPGGDTSLTVTGVAKNLIDRCARGATVYRSVGGVLDLTHKSEIELQRFRAAFRLALSRKVPGLVCNDSIATGKDEKTARTAARNAMSDGGPVRGINLPLGSPMIRPAPRSGGSPADLPNWTKDGRCKITKEYADLPTQLKRRHLQTEKATLTTKFTPQRQTDSATLRWPNVFSQTEDEADRPNNIVFPFGSHAMPRIAVLHADGNGMGNLFAKAVETLTPDKVRRLSQALAAATQDAVRDAMGPVVGMAVDNVVPARPVVLGGDDVSILLRADLAMDFAIAFAEAYEKCATAAVAGSGLLAPGQKLTTKIGIVVIGPNQPFAQAYALAESLASAARDETQSRIAFHRVTTSAIPADADALLRDGDAADNHTLWRAAHTLDQVKALRALSRMLDDDDIGRGKLRQVAELLKSDRAEAQRVYERALKIVKDRAADSDTFKDFWAALQAAGMPNLSSPGDPAKPVWCPLLQAHDLSHIDRSQA